MRVLISLAVALAASGMTVAVATAQTKPTIAGVWKARSPGPLMTEQGDLPPLKPAARKVYDQRRAKFLKGDRTEDPPKRCKPPGEPRLMASGTPFEIIETPDRIAIAYEWNRLVRMIEIGAPKDVLGPVYFGQNAGKWEGDTLVVDVQALHDNTYLDGAGLPHSENARLTQRFRRVGENEMEVVIKVDDPVTFTKPWTTRLTFDRLPGYRIKEDICLERESLVGKI